jgi:hypothetical protein
LASSRAAAIHDAASALGVGVQPGCSPNPVAPLLAGAASGDSNAASSPAESNFVCANLLAQWLRRPIESMGAWACAP